MGRLSTPPSGGPARRPAARLVGAASAGLVRLALLSFPRRFRRVHGDDMRALHRQHLDEALRHGAGRAVRHTLGALADLVAAGVQERLGRGRGRARRGRDRARELRSRAAAAALGSRGGDGELRGRDAAAELRGGGDAREVRGRGGARRHDPTGPRRWRVELPTDLGSALGRLAQNRGFLALTVVPVALGIAATTTIFSVADGVFLRPLPYPEPDRLHVVGSAWPRDPDSLSGLSVPNFLDLRERVGSFERFGVLMGSLGLDLQHADGVNERVQVVRVAAGAFELLGARAAVGRLPQPGELSAVVLSHDEWRDSWGADADAVGRTVTLSGEVLTVVGVLEADFVPPEALIFGSREPGYWAPLDLDDPSLADTRAFGGFWVLGRLARGVSTGSAQQELDAVADALAREYPDANTRDDAARMLRLRDLHGYTVGSSGDRVALLLAAVGMLLLISCINVAGLFLVRGHERAADLALRAALGAGRARLAGLVVAEGCVVAVLGGVLGAALAHVGVESFAALSPGDIPRLSEIGLDARGLAFATAASALTVLLSTALPVVQATRCPPGEALRRGARTASPVLGAWRVALMAMETALVVVLLSAAAVFMRGFFGMVTADRGIDPDGVLTLEVSSAVRDPEVNVEVFRTLAGDLREIPGSVSVTGATFSLVEPMGGLWEVAVPPQIPEEPAWSHVVLPGYFETLGIPLVAGGGFSWSDDLESPPTVIVAESLAQELFGEVDVVGRELALSDERLARATIVGVAADTLRRTQEGDFEVGRAVYISYLQRPWLGTMTFAVRHEVPLLTVAPAVRDAVRRLGSRVTLVRVDTLRSFISRGLVEPRFYSWLLTVFSLVALVIAAVGIYATLAFMVAGRRREIGIRVALGASPARVLGGVVRHGLTIVATGLGLGLPAALYVSTHLGGLVPGIEPGGLGPHVVTIAILAVAGGVASLEPALRARRIEPARVLAGD